MFQPVVPLPGLAGWTFLNKTLEKQTAAFNASAPITRDTAYFEAEIGKIATAEDLVSDRRLLRVALGAFGLEDDLNSKFFIKTILAEGTRDDEALANRLSDDRYAKLSEAFGFDRSSGPRTIDPGFGQTITAQYREREFEIAIGTQDEAMRLALNAKRELSSVLSPGESDQTGWYRILGTPPLRTVFETALGLPDGFGQLDIDRQVLIFQEKSRQTLGINELGDFSDTETLEAFVRDFLVRDQIKSFSVQSSGSIALTLLQLGQSQNPF